ncbi:villin [Artemisia annua]|uniref:Villin n=1 Tax=Artemisia annua TaxID=35608 RepID=A0A2U1NXI9_ARTAN|nr:villin [Artemisia annua]
MSFDKDDHQPVEIVTAACRSRTLGNEVIGSVLGTTNSHLAATEGKTVKYLLTLQNNGALNQLKRTQRKDEEGLTLYPYNRLTTASFDPTADIDVTKRETYLLSAEFREKFGMTKEAFYKLPKLKQNKLKMAL